MTSRGFQQSCNNPPGSSVTGRRANPIHHLTPDFSPAGAAAAKESQDLGGLHPSPV
uniref:Uncharacterized protein n=1 Tax=Theropithecus gelada TaxID=9565 RepID=A0A8D2K9Z3_THEGE